MKLKSMMSLAMAVGAFGWVGCEAPVESVEGDMNLGTSQAGLAQTSSSMVRLVDANITKGNWGEANLASGFDRDYQGLNLIKYIASPSRSYVPDILTFQEMKNDASGYHTCAEFRNKLQTELVASGVSSAVASYGYRDAQTTGGACIIFRQSKFTAGADSNAIAGITGSDCNGSGNKSIAFHLTVNGTSRNVSVASIHFPNNGASCTPQNAATVRMFLNNVAGAKIMAGDFNVMNGEGNGWQTDMANAGYTKITGIWDHTTSDGIDYVWLKNYTGVVSKTWIDYAFASPFDPNYPTQQRHYSDHHGAIVDISI